MIISLGIPTLLFKLSIQVKVRTRSTKIEMGAIKLRRNPALQKASVPSSDLIQVVEREN
jgi:hypothetical protein